MPAQVSKWIPALLLGIAIGVLAGRLTSPRPETPDGASSDAPPQGEAEPGVLRALDADPGRGDIARLVRSAAPHSDRLKSAVIFGRVATLTADEVEELLREVASSAEPEVAEERRSLEDALILRLLELDPVRALRSAVTRHPGERADDAEQRAGRWVARAMAALAKTDLAEARRQAESLPEKGWLRRQAIEAVLDHAAPQDFQSLLAWAKATDPRFDEFGDGVDDFTDMTAYMITPDNGLFTRWAKTDLAAAKGYVLGLEPGAERNQGLAGIAEALAVTDPDAALRFAENLSDANERSAVWYRTIHLLASTRPADAARLLDELPSGRVKQSTVEVLTRQWLRQDRDAALAWAKSLGDSPRQQRVYRTAVHALARRDPEAAVDLAVNIHGLAARRDAIREVTRQWFTDDPLSATAWLRSEPDHEFRDEIYRFALPLYANRDPAGSAEYFDQLVAEHGLSGNLSAAAGQIAYTLARLDVDRALEWVGTIRDDATGQAAMEQLLTSVAFDDPGKAMQLVETQPTVSPGTIADLATAFTREDPDAAFEWIARQPAEARWGAVNRALADLVRDDPTAAAEQLRASAEILDPTGWNRLTTRAENISRAIATTDMEGALEWAASLPDGEVRNAAIAMPLHFWLDSDPHAASRWVSQLEDDALRQHAVSQLASSVRDSDPEAAFIWAGTLHGDERLATMRRALRTWRETDPEAARRAIQSADLTEDERAELQTEVLVH